MDTQLNYIQSVARRVNCRIFNQDFILRTERDQRNPKDGRIFIQFQFERAAEGNKQKELVGGRKWYLSEYMTEDEIIKTIYAAFEACVKHEVMESFKVDQIVLFNPHVYYKELLSISDREIKRSEEIKSDIQG